MTTDQKIKLRDYWYSLQDYIADKQAATLLPESKRVELEHLVREIEVEAREEGRKEERERVVEIAQDLLPMMESLMHTAHAHNRAVLRLQNLNAPEV